MSIARAACVFTLAIMLLAAVPGFAAQKSALVGSWRGSSTAPHAPPITIDFVFSADGRYAERSRYNGGKSMSFGHYKVIRKNVIQFTIEDWEPRQDCKPTGCEPVKKPPAFQYEVQTLTESTMRLKEKKFGGMITLKRMR